METPIKLQVRPQLLSSVVIADLITFRREALARGLGQGERRSEAHERQKAFLPRSSLDEVSRAGLNGRGLGRREANLRFFDQVYRQCVLFCLEAVNVVPDHFAPPVSKPEYIQHVQKDNFNNYVKGSLQANVMKDGALFLNEVAKGAAS